MNKAKLEGPHPEDVRSYGEEKASSFYASWGLRNGEIEPLADHFARGFSLDDELRNDILQAITASGDAAWQLKLAKLKRGRGLSRDEKHIAFERDWEVGNFILGQLPKLEKVEAAVQAAMTHFSLSRSVVYASWRTWKAMPLNRRFTSWDDFA